MADAHRLTELAADLISRLAVPDGAVCVALSGGADSAALLWLLTHSGADVEAIHVSHGLATSSLMSTAAGQIAAMCGVRLEMAFVDPPGTAEHHLREVRHAALLDRAGDRPVLMAHTADDQAETVLMRSLRGTGIDGLGGIAPARGQIRHPMLSITRKEARDVATLAGLPFRDDPTNEDPAILRNRMRSEVLPTVEAALGHSPRDPLLRLAASAAETAELLDRLADGIEIEERPGEVRVPLGALLAVGDTIAARVIRRAMIQIAGPYPPDRSAVGRILDVVHGRYGATEVEPGLRVRPSEAHLVIAGGIRENDRPGTSVLAGDSTSWAEWSFRMTEVAGPTVVPLSPRRLLVPGDAGRLTVRSIGVDDRVTGRKASDALADAGVSSEDRRRWPIVLCDDDPVWVPLVRSRVWPGHLPGRYLCVVAVQEPSWQTSER